MASNLELAAFAALRAACDAEHGVILRVEVPPGITAVTPALRAKQVLYRFRSELNDAEFKQIQIRLSPDKPDTELWLVKVKAQAAEAELKLETKTITF